MNRDHVTEAKYLSPISDYTDFHRTENNRQLASEYLPLLDYCLEKKTLGQMRSRYRFCFLIFFFTETTSSPLQIPDLSMVLLTCIAIAGQQASGMVRV